DTSMPGVRNGGRCNVDFSFKPIKYVLTPAIANANDAETEPSKSSEISSKLDRDIEKLNEIRRAEKALEKEQQQTESTTAFQTRRNCTHGKLTQRDVKNCRKLD